MVRIHPRESNVLAQVVLALLAQEALLTRHAGLDGDPVAGFQVRHAIAAPDDNAGGLVAEDAVALEHERADAARLPEVHVRAADPGRLDVQQHLSRARGVHGGLGGLEVVVCGRREGGVGQRRLDHLAAGVHAAGSICGHLGVLLRC